MKKTKLLVSTMLLVTSLASFVSCGGTTNSSSSASSASNDSSSDTSTPSRNEVAEAWQIPEAGFDYDTEVEINFYSTMGDALQTKFNAFLKDFNEIYPNIKVNHTTPGGYDDLLDQIKTEISVGNGPDVAYCYADHVALYNKTKAVVTMDNLIYDDELGLTAEQANDFIAGYYNEGRQFGDGLMYTLPFSKSTEILYYNKDVFAKLNLSVPDHWFSESSSDTTSMEYVCGKLKEEYPEATPLGYDSGANWFITMCEQYNSPYTSATGDHFLFNNETNKTFMTKFKDWFDKGYVTTQKVLGSYTSTKFVEQSSFMSIGSSAGATHQVPTATDGVYPFEVGMAEIPQVDASNKKVISQGPSLCIFNQGDSQKVLASWLFVKYFTTNTAFQAEFSIASGYVPVLKSVADNEFFKKNTASVGSPLSQNVREGTTNWEIYDVTTGEWSDSGIAIKKDENGNVTNNPGVDQKSRCSAEAAQLCLKQEDNYFTSPAFLGSSVARTSVENLVTQYLSGQTSDINTAFADAIDYCTNNS